MSGITTPALRWIGSKWRIANWIIEQLPPHTTYVEPYAGGCSVLLRKPPSTFEVVNDLNSEVVNFFEVLRTRPAELIAAIDLTPYARQEYQLSWRREKELEPVEQARRFYVRCRMSFGSGEGRFSTGWRFQKNTNRGKRVVDEWSKVDHLWAIARRFKEAMIEHDDALKILDRYDTAQTVFYVDPPYVTDTRQESNIYSHEMTDDDHRSLAEKLHGLDGMVVLSGYPSALYDELYAGWRTLEKSTQTNGKAQRTEKLWISPNCSRVEVFPMFRNQTEVKS
jgi:DNA adenine methylase